MSPDLNCDVRHRDDDRAEFFDGTACGTFVAVGGTLYGPAFVPAGGNASPRTPFETVEQANVTGAGTSTNPYVMETTVVAGPLRIVQRDSYVAGFAQYRTDIRITNTSPSAVSAVVYRAGDCFLQNSDVGYGLVSGSAVACAVRNPDGTVRVEQFAPITSGSSYMEGHFASVWARIGSQLPFANLCDCDSYVDNGAGLSWQPRFEAGETITISHLTAFAPAGPRADTNGDGRVRVAVMGDSYIAGVGGLGRDESYELGSDYADNRCRRTVNSWGYRVAESLGALDEDILFSACTGATSEDVLVRGQHPRSDYRHLGGVPQIAALRAYENADIVLLSIGGNDVGFASIIVDCLAVPCGWFQTENLRATARNERYRLKQTYERVLAAAREGNPSAEVWVATYPSAAGANACAATGYAPGVGHLPNGYGINSNELRLLREELLANLNASIRWAAAASGVKVLDLSETTNGHELCTDAPYFEGLTVSGRADRPYIAGAGSFHPNYAGHSAIATAVWARYGLEFGQAGLTPLGGNGEIPLLAGSLRLGPNAGALQDAAPADVAFLPGNQVHLRVENAPPGPRIVVVRSIPTVVGRFTVPESGTAETSFTVPATLAPGLHLVTIEDESGARYHSSQLLVDAPAGCEMGSGEADVDGDLLPDRCDADATDGPSADVDGDGVPNGNDNCLTVSNRSQDDRNADGVGDACDPTAGASAVAGYRLSAASRPATDPAPASSLPTAQSTPVATPAAPAPNPAPTASAPNPAPAGASRPSVQPRAPLAAPSKVSVRRSGARRILVAWPAVAGATSYRVTVRFADGARSRQRVVTVRGTRVTLGIAVRRGRAVVSVNALDAGGMPGAVRRTVYRVLTR